MADKTGEIAPPSFDEMVASDLPHYYFNGFQNGAGLSDVTVALQLNAKPVCLLNMSFTTAKTLSVLLGQLIATVEADTGQEIMTTERIEEGARRAGRIA